jgi:heme/copper-type cytochrome/quinol oxidase subunit 2
MVCKPGVYYGQCSELCGVAHGYMPIQVIAVSLYDWIDFVNNFEELN